MAKKSHWNICGLCGELKMTTREHVVPRCLYPKSKHSSKFQRITIAACVSCNNGSADDDAHFRNVVSVAGEANEVVNELWYGPIARSFKEVDGWRRALDIVNIMQPAPDVGPEHYRIFPAQDERVLRIVRKIIRGLSCYHDLEYPILDNQIFADVSRFEFPLEFINEMQCHSADPDILEYRFFDLVNENRMKSAWLFRFFKRTSFIGIVFESESALREQLGNFSYDVS